MTEQNSKSQAEIDKEPIPVTQLAKINIASGGMVLHTLDDMRTVSKIIFASNLAPEGYKSVEQVFVGIQSGGEIGLKPMQALQSICVIHGRPTLWGDAALGLVKKSGLLEEFREFMEGEDDAITAVCISRRKGQKESVRTEFSVADARTAGLWGKAGTWKTHWKRMLKYKSRAFNLRDNFPDVLMGMHLTEEMEGEQLKELPECDTPPRDERRKQIPSQDVTDGGAGIDGYAKEAAKNANCVVADAKKALNKEEPTERPVSDTEEGKEADDAGTTKVDKETGEITEDITLNDVVEIFEGMEHGTCDFSEFAGFVLCLEDDFAPGDFTVDMLEHLKRELETAGIPAELMGVE